MKRKKNKTLIAILIVIICIVVGIIVAKTIIDNNKPKCPYQYNYDDSIKLCVRILETDVITNINQYGLKTETCPRGYTRNKSGIPGLEVPQLDVPGIPKKCYQRITQTPYN